MGRILLPILFAVIGIVGGVAYVQSLEDEAKYQAEMDAYEVELVEGVLAMESVGPTDGAYTLGRWRDQRKRQDAEPIVDENGEEVLPPENSSRRKRWRDRPERKGLAHRFGKGLQQIAIGAGLLLVVFVGWKWAIKK